MTTMTLLDAIRLIHDADSLFRRAALAWERGNNSGDSAYKERCDKQSEACHDRAEGKLKPLGITVDYPGLYPSFTHGGYCYHTTESAVSAAVSVSVNPPIVTLDALAQMIQAKTGIPTKANYCEDDMGVRYLPGRDELRVLPLSASGNAILCRAGFNKHCNAEMATRHLAAGELPTWESLKVYDAS